MEANKIKSPPTSATPRSVRQQLRDASDGFRDQKHRLIVANKTSPKTAALLRLCRMLKRPGIRLVQMNHGKLKVEGVEDHQMLYEIGCKRIAFVSVPILPVEIPPEQRQALDELVAEAQANGEYD